MSDFGDYVIWTILGLLVLGLAGAFGYGINSEMQHKEWFMERCLKDHKDYECDAMWRAGDSSANMVVVPIITGR
jgi:hypothetical protein